MNLKRSLNGALAGGLAATVWAAQQAADKRAFDSDYDDVELLGKAVTRGDAWPAAGVALHVANGAVFGAAYSHCARSCPARRVAVPSRWRWPSTSPCGRWAAWWTATTPRARTSPRSPATAAPSPQAAWRHLLFGLVLGELERRLNAEGADEPPEFPVSSNGHGNIELAVGATEAS